MDDMKQTGVGIVGGLLLVLCCAGPILIIALSSISLTAWLTSAYYVLVPAVLVLLALVGLKIYRRQRQSEDNPVRTTRARRT